MPQNTQVCSQCFQGITNPICEVCHTKQLAIWMNDYGFPPRTIQKVVKEIRRQTPTQDYENFCILCNTENVSICTFCFFFKVENILTKLDLPSEVVAHFLAVFNYKLYKQSQYTP